MRNRYWFLAGPLAALLLVAAIAGLAQGVPGYDSVRQTVSEIGEMDSPMRWPFAAALCAVALAVLVFAAALHRYAAEHHLSQAPTWLLVSMTVPLVAIAVFAFPHPLHNVFGPLEIVGYQAPLALALTWRRNAEARALARFSAIMAAVVWLTIGMNFTTFHRSGAIWEAIAPYYGLVQRALFASWCLWIFGFGLMLFGRGRAVPPA